MVFDLDSIFLSLGGSVNVDPSNPVGLFRREALAELNGQFGEPVKLMGLSGWLLSGFFVLVFCAAAVFAACTNYSHKETVIGQVAPIEGAIRVMASKAGYVDHVYVEEGADVQAGQVIASIAATPTLQSGASLLDELKDNRQGQMRAQRQQANARSEQIHRQMDEVNEHMRGVQLDLEKLTNAYSLQQQRVRIAELAVQAAHQLGDEGMMAKITVRAKDEELLAARQQLASIDRERGVQASLDHQLQAQIARLKAEARIAESEAAALSAEMTEKNLTSEATYADRLQAPVAGTVSALQIQKGHAVNPASIVAIIVPKGTTRGGSKDLEVELWAPSRAVGFVQLGTPARIMYDGFPYQSFGFGKGEVIAISRSPIMPGELPIPIDTKEQMFRIRVRLDQGSLQAYGREWPLSPGMRLSADLMLEERTLLDWLLEPLHAFSKRQG